MIVVDKIPVVGADSKTVKAPVLPHTLYIIGHYFYHAGDVRLLGDGYQNLISYMETLSVTPNKIAALVNHIESMTGKIGENEDWNHLRRSKWWEWACVRLLAFRQGQFNDEIASDPAGIIQEYFKKANKNG